MKVHSFRSYVFVIVSGLNIYQDLWHHFASMLTRFGMWKCLILIYLVQDLFNSFKVQGLSKLSSTIVGLSNFMTSYVSTSRTSSPNIDQGVQVWYLLIRTVIEFHLFSVISPKHVSRWFNKTVWYSCSDHEGECKISPCITKIICFCIWSCQDFWCSCL